MKPEIREMYQITASGSRLYPFINAIRQSGIICMAQYCRGDHFFCRIYARDLRRLQEIADDFGIRLERTAQRSLIGWLRRYRLRFGIPLGILLCAGILFYFSNVVATIEIRGNSAVSDSVILAVLARDGIAEGTWIGDIDFTSSERHLRAAVEEIAWVAMRNTGNRLVVEISEATPKVEMLDERTPCNIVSLYDAQITDVRVYSGHLTRMIGDGVAAGDMLVSGVFEDDKGHVTYRHAIADITGIYTKEAELSEYFVTTNSEPTGRVHKRRYFRLFFFKIPLSSGNHGFSTFTETESDIPFSFLGAVLPFGMIQQTCIETETEILTRSEDETRLALNAAIVRYEKNFLTDVEILDRNITYSSDENGMTAKLVYTVEGEIGRISDIYVK